jgi:two-component system response regulator ChvI
LIPIEASSIIDDSIPLNLATPSEEILFAGYSQNYCVCFIDIIGSTQITAHIADARKIRSYYSIFINNTASIVRNFNAKIIKNTGDCLIYYFPKTSDSANELAFKDVMRCGLTMIESLPTINSELVKNGLPPINFRISADYGKVEVAKSVTSQSDDFFGSTVDLCAKINSKAFPNGMVVGDDLYQIVKKSNSDEFDFQELTRFSLADLRYKYPIYSVSKKNINGINSLNPNQEFSEFKPSYLQPPSQKQANLMIVDDEPDALFTYKTFVANEGHNVDAFTDPQEALKCFATKNQYYYDLVIMDIRMPSLNGLQLYYRLKAINMSLKIMFVSALDAAEELISVLPDIKNTDIIKKPVDEEHFLHSVRAALLSS